MILLSTQKVMQLHRFLMQETGGLDGLRDEGLFDSAVQGPFATFGGQELYPSIEEKAANPHYSNKKATSLSADGFGPSGESRTHGLLNPIQARYQTALHPDVWPGALTGDAVYYNASFSSCQFFFPNFKVIGKDFFNIDICKIVKSIFN